MAEGAPQEEIFSPKYFAETQRIIDALLEDPTIAFKCAHEHDDPAVGIYEVPQGCVALPGLETQALCMQHVSTNGSFEGMRLVVDLSIGGEWSRSDYGGEPDFIIIVDPSNGEFKLVSVSEIADE